MTIKKAVDHFVFKFNNVWKPTQPDVDALNTIMNFVKDKHEKQLRNNDLFAKLYIMVYSQYLERYNSTVFDDIPRKELSKILDIPTYKFIQRLTDRLNDSELYSLFDELNISMDHPATKTDEVRNKETDVLQESLKNKNNLEKLTGQIWDYETVKENIELQINNVINEFR